LPPPSRRGGVAGESRAQGRRSPRRPSLLAVSDDADVPLMGRPAL